MSNAYAALFAIADADRDGVCGRAEGFKFFQRFSVSQETLEEVQRRQSRVFELDNSDDLTPPHLPPRFGAKLQPAPMAQGSPVLSFARP